MNGRLTLGSLFDGSGGFPLAGLLNGIEPKWLAEIEPFPCRVTAARFPGIPNHGDVTKIDGAKIEPVDIITFGSPCQDLSVAGKQKGIHDGERSSLFFEAIRIIKEMRDATTNEFPRYAVWENVPGAFSSHNGEDFKAVLEAFCGVANREGVTIPFPQGGKWKLAGCIVGDGFSIAWRQYDAQFWGVAQRRKRIYLIADFGSERAGEILFKSEGLRGDSAESGEEREGTTGDAAGSAGGSDQVKCLNPWDPEGKRIFRTDGAMQTLFAGEGGHLRGVCYSIEGNVCDRDAKQNGMGISEDVCPSLNTQDRHAVAFMGGQGANARSIAWKDDGKCPTLRAAESGSNQVPDVVYGISRSALKGGEGSNGGMPIEEGISPTIVAQGTGAVAYQDQILCMNDQGGVMNVSDKAMTLRAQEHGHQPVIENHMDDSRIHAVAFQQNQRDEVRDMGEKAGALTAQPGVHNQNYVCYPEIARSLCARADSSPCVDRGQNVVAIDCRNMVGNEEVSATLQAKSGGGYSLNFINPVVYDARSNGDGSLSPTTGDHENRVTDYTAICVGNGQLHQTNLCDKAGALNCMHDQQAVITSGRPPRKYIVRRLTPLECCRLQGFPDWWCDGVDGSDSAKYKMWGNGIALPCAADVLKSLKQHAERITEA